MATTSGGLVKRSMTFTQRQMAEMERLAAKRNTSTAAIMRQLIDWGLKVNEHLEGASGPVEDLAVKLAAKEVV